MGPKDIGLSALNTLKNIISAKFIASKLTSLLGVAITPTMVTAAALAIFIITMIFFIACSKNKDKDNSPPESTSGIQTPTKNKEQNIGYKSGDKKLTCAFQQFQQCSPNQYCKNSNWTFASDTDLCCAGKCIDRIQAKNVKFSGILGDTATIEKLDNRYVVWWGLSNLDSQLDFPITAHENFAETTYEHETIFSFKAKNNKNIESKYLFKITDRGTEIEARQAFS